MAACRSILANVLCLLKKAHWSAFPDVLLIVCHGPGRLGASQSNAFKCAPSSAHFGGEESEVVDTCSPLHKGLAQAYIITHFP